MYDLHEISDIDQLDSLRNDWEKLLETTQRASLFHTLPWFELYWRHFGAEQKLRVLVVTQDGHVEGILPLVVRKEDRKIGSVRVLTWPLDDWGSFYGPLGSDPSTLLSVGLNHINKTARNWDLIDLRWMDAKGELAAATQNAMSAAGLSSYCRVRDKTALIDTRGTWEDYLAGRTSKWRNNLRRWQKRTAERGEVTYERYRPAGAAQGDADPRSDLLNQCIDIAKRSWQGTSQTGTTISHHEIRGFIRAAHKIAAQQGCLDLNMLRVDGRLVAFAYNYFFRGSVYGLRVGYDDDYSREGVGNLLYYYALEDSFRRDDHTYDLGPGSLDCKKYFWTEVIDLVQFTHFRRASLRAQALKWKGCLTGQLTPSGVAVG